MPEQKNVKSEVAIDFNLKGLMFAIILGFTLYGLMIGIIRTYKYFRYNTIKYVITNPNGIEGHIVITDNNDNYTVHNSRFGRKTKTEEVTIEYPKLSEISPNKIPNKDVLTCKIKGQFHLYTNGVFNEGTNLYIYLNGKQIYDIKSLMGKLNFKYHTRILERGKDSWLVNIVSNH